MRTRVNLWESRLSKETQPGTSRKGRSRRDRAEIQLGIVGSAHGGSGGGGGGWGGGGVRSLWWHEDIGDRVEDRMVA